MASASILYSEDQFQCSICLGVFTDPISIPCGHNYCETCITQVWDGTDVCKCPLCNKIFYKRPEVSVNKVLSELADQFKKSSVKQEAAKADEVSCDICTETKLKAVKSCLVCKISYCETHLEPHHRVAVLKQHKLKDPVKNLEDFMCQKHDRPLELFCKTDNTCVCSFCTESDHRAHHVVSLEEEWKIKKTELGKKEAEVQQMVQKRQLKIQEVKHSVELSKKDADREIADSVQVFNALISCIQRSQSKLIDVIEEKQKTTEKEAEGFIKDLQQEITQLEKRGSELEQLSHTEDHLHLLQNFASINTPPPTKDWTKVNVHQSPHVGTVRTALALLEKTLSQEFEKKLRGVEQLREIKRPVKKKAARPTSESPNQPRQRERHPQTHDHGQGNVTAPPTVKIQTIVRGQTFDSHRALLQRVKQVGGLHVEETTSGKVLVLFCPVSSRHMTDIEAAMSEVPEGATVILVVMHHTCDINYTNITRSLSGYHSWEVEDFMDVLYHDSVHGLLTCPLNDKAVRQLYAALLKHSTVTPVAAPVYSGGSTGHAWGNVTAPPTVKIQTIVRGQTFDSHRALLQRVKQVGGLHVEETTSAKVLVLFCPVSSRHMTDIEAAMSEVPEGATVILVVMHHTYDINYTNITRSLSGDHSWEVEDFVDVLYHESVHGLLTCPLNDKAMAQLHAALLKHSTVSPVAAPVYSGGSTGRGYSGGNTAGMYSGGSPGHGYGGGSGGSWWRLGGK